ncbi:Acyl-CoA thioesterase II [gamma proteobacterium HdN1]|nr:Acyl-CoA thioesterase II [gamma proteobacterium HdN1]
MHDLIEGLVHLLDLERLDDNLFRGESKDIGGHSVFGGQVVAQALIAAQRTVDPARLCHSLHAYFLRPGDMKAPIIFEVDRQRDGGSFTMRRVVAIQHGQSIFNMACSFQAHEQGVEHQDSVMPEVPSWKDVPSEAELKEKVRSMIPEKLLKIFDQPSPIELRPIHPTNPFNPKPTEPRKNVWLKAVGTLPDDQALHQALLAYASDFHLLGTSMLPHSMSFFQPQVQSASLDHSIWFHDNFRIDEWLLYAMHSPWAKNARGLSHGRIFTESGKLIASTVQEGLIRKR